METKNSILPCPHPIFNLQCNTDGNQGFVKGEELSSYCVLISSFSFIFIYKELTYSQNVRRQAVRLYFRIHRPN